MKMFSPMAKEAFGWYVNAWEDDVGPLYLGKDKATAPLPTPRTPRASPITRNRSRPSISASSACRRVGSTLASSLCVTASPP